MYKPNRHIKAQYTVDVQAEATQAQYEDNIEYKGRYTNETKQPIQTETHSLSTYRKIYVQISLCIVSWLH